MSKDYPNARDCPHGRQWGKCDTCDMLEALAELNTLRAENERLRRIEAAARVINDKRTGFSEPVKPIADDSTENTVQSVSGPWSRHDWNEFGIALAEGEG